MVLSSSQPGRLSGQFHLGHFWLSLISFLVNIAGHNTETEHSLRQTDASLKTDFNTEVIYGPGGRAVECDRVGHQQGVD